MKRRLRRCYVYCHRVVRATWIYLKDGDEEAYDRRLSPYPLVRLDQSIRDAGRRLATALTPVFVAASRAAQSLLDAMENREA